MSEHRANIAWKRGSTDFTYQAYSRDHTWSFESGIVVTASAAPAFLGSPERVDPEEAFVASLSSCHMLTFLALAARKRFVVDAYEDAAVGFMEKNAEAKLAITRVVLHPRVTFDASATPSSEEIEQLHEHSHAECFLANSVLTRISVEPA